MTHFELAEPSLEAIFIEHVGRPADDDATLAAGAPTAPAHARGRRLMARRDPLLPNAGIVARREYRDRTRSPLFIASTIVLMGLALVVTLAPIAIRYLDSQTVTRIAVVAEDDDLALGAIGVDGQPAQHHAGGRGSRRPGSGRSSSSGRPTPRPPRPTWDAATSAGS